MRGPRTRRHAAPVDVMMSTTSGGFLTPKGGCETTSHHILNYAKLTFRSDVRCVLCAHLGSGAGLGRRNPTRPHRTHTDIDLDVKVLSQVNAPNDADGDRM